MYIKVYIMAVENLKYCVLWMAKTPLNTISLARGLTLQKPCTVFEESQGIKQEFPRNVAEFFRILRKPMICTLQNPKESPGIPRNPQESPGIPRNPLES